MTKKHRPIDPSCFLASMTLGRSLAFCTHPAAAWRRLSSRGRILLLAAYFSASYVVTLAGLLVVSLAAG